MTDNRIRIIFKHYGFQAQEQKTIEELGELVTAIVKFQRSGSYEDFQHFTEEVVDVEIMIQQLKLGICSTIEGREQYKNTKEYKLNREIKRIKTQQENALK